MSLQTVAHKFVELCRQGKNFDVMRTMYAPNITASQPIVVSVCMRSSSDRWPAWPAVRLHGITRYTEQANRVTFRLVRAVAPTSGKVDCQIRPR